MKLSQKKIQVRLISNNKSQLIICCLRLINYFIKENIEFSGPIALPTKSSKFCLLRSPHVNKDSREHLQFFVYKKFFYIEYGDYLKIKTLIPNEIQIELKVID